MPDASDGMGRTILDIGYEKAGMADFLVTLRNAGASLLVDVRERPQSRRAGFSRKSLSATVEAAGIRYLHFRALGTPPEGRAMHRVGDYAGFWDCYERQLREESAQTALDDLAELALSETVCLLCYEADWRICHRKRLGELLAIRGFVIEHLRAEPEFC
jgi:uncharacterized protein (DUF488 family)